MTNTNLPDETLVEIFSRLPAKSVGRCRCLSKLWQKSLSNSQFINLHLSRCKKTHQEQALLLIKHGRSLHTIASPIEDYDTLKYLLLLPPNWVSVWGSCDGLVLLMNDDKELFVVNPILQHQVRVPHPPLPPHLKRNIINQMYGFGYDISTDDYKILNLSYTSSSSEDGRYSFAHVYSLKKSVWREVMCDCDFRYQRLSQVVGAHVNGVIHWLTHTKVNVFDSRKVLVSFNLADEVFGVIPLPADYDQFQMVSVFEGCLSLISREHMKSDLWTMKEYGVQGSWTKMSFGTRGMTSNIIKPLCFVGEKKFAVVGRNSLSLCDLETQKTKSMVVDGTKASFEDACVFFETLVSPNQSGISR